MENELFTTEKIPKIYIRMCLPLMMSMIVTLIYNLADTYFVAQTADTDLVAGVSLGAPVFTLLMAFGNIFGQGGASLVSRQLGKGDKNAVRHVSAFCFYITILLGAIAAVFMLLLRDPILSLLGAAEGTWEHASAYYTCLAIGAPAIMLSFIHSNLLRSEGLSKESLIGTVGGALINIVLDPILISGLQMGAKGAAIATVIGYLCADVFFVIIVHRRSRLFSMKPSEMNIPGNSLIQILGIGIPAAIVNVMQSVSVVMVNQFLLPYGSDRIAAMGIVLKVNLIATLILTGFTFGAQPMFGYYYGSGDHRRFQELSSFCMKFVGPLSLLLTAVLFPAAGILLRFFMDNDQIVSNGTLMLRCQVITMFFVGMIMLITIMFQSTGKIAASFILSVSRQGIVFFIVLLAAVRIGGYTGILAAQAIADAITFVIAASLYAMQLSPRMSRRIHHA